MGVRGHGLPGPGDGRRRRSRGCILVLSIVGMVAGTRTTSTAPGQICQFEVVATISGPECSPGTFSTFHAWGMDGQANVVGSVTCVAVPRAALWLYGAPTALALSGPPSTSESTAFDMLSPEQIVGVATPNGQNFDVAAYWQVGSGTLLGALPGHYTSNAQGINAFLQIVGESSNPGNGDNATFVWEDHVFQVLQLPIGPSAGANAINDQGQVTGWMGNAPFDANGYIWDAGKIIDLGKIKGGTSAEGLAINRHGRVAGRGWLPKEGTIFGVRRAIYWDGSTIIDLGTLPEREESISRDLNDVDQIVGTSDTTGLPTKGFLWQKGEMYDINDLVIGDFPGSTMGAALCINNEGLIVASTSAGVRVLLRPVNSAPGDIDNNCTVNVTDLLMLISEWGKQGSLADVNKDGIVNVTDLLQVLADWG